MNCNVLNFLMTLRADGINTIAAPMVIMAIADGEAHPMGAVAGKCEISCANMTGIIDTLEKKKVVRRVRGHDRRSFLIQLMPRMMDVLKQLSN